MMAQYSQLKTCIFGPNFWWCETTFYDVCLDVEDSHQKQFTFYELEKTISKLLQFSCIYQKKAIGIIFSLNCTLV